MQCTVVRMNFPRCLDQSECLHWFTQVPHWDHLLLITGAFTYFPLCLHAKSLQSCLTLYDPTDCSPPGSSVHEILQARMLEWVSIPFSRGSSRPRIKPVFSVAPALQADSLPLEPQVERIHLPMQETQRPGFSPWNGRSLEEGMVTHPGICMENFMGTGAWQAIDHGAMKSQTWMSNWTHTHRIEVPHISKRTCPSTFIILNLNLLDALRNQLILATLTNLTGNPSAQITFWSASQSIIFHLYRTFLFCSLLFLPLKKLHLYCIYIHRTTCVFTHI